MARHDVYDNDEQTHQNSQKSLHAITVAKRTLDLPYECMAYNENDVNPQIQKTRDTFKGTFLRVLNFSCVWSC